VRKVDTYEYRICATDELQDAAFGLRYDVYCQEFGWEPVNYLKREIDQYDQYSTQAIILDNEQCIACVRAIEGWPFPMEERIWDQIEPEFKDHIEELHSLTELSRFCVSTKYRNTEITSMLALTMMALGRRLGHGHAIAMMSPVLSRLLKRIGVEFCVIGDEIEYHGIRSPYYIMLGYTESNLVPSLRNAYKHILLALR
jgi:N-acyl-L-homoserine lactone synthetase